MQLQEANNQGNKSNAALATVLPKESISHKIGFLQGLILKLKEIGFQQQKSQLEDNYRNDDQ